jgi:HEAT repeat protein
MKSLEGLRQALDSPDWYVRSRAIGLLYGFGAEAVPAIIHALDDRNGSIVSQAADMLSQKAPNDPRTLPALIRALTHPDVQARASAVTALERLGPEALPALRGAMTDSNPSVARMAREAVSRLERRSGN